MSLLASTYTAAGSKQQHHPDRPPALTAATAALVSYLTTTAVMYWWQWRRRRQYQDDCLQQLQHQQQLLLQQQQRRQEERTGRIRAEVKLRTALKEIQRLKYSYSPKDNETDTTKPGCDDGASACTPQDNNHIMILRAIGTVTSPYTKRMGTPRQPQLVPSSRGFVEFHSSIVPAASLEGIDEYSCIWIIFGFHANTDYLVNDATSNSKTPNKRTKIRPPRGGGVKMGQLATRAPHRPNPLGLSLVHLERWDAAQRRLYISGLDLVHGTPVYDIKPFVPWDVPGYSGTLQPSSPLNLQQQQQQQLKVPSWVSQRDEISQVTFTPEAAHQLEHMVHTKRLAPLYTTENDGYRGALQTLQEVLAQDPRSSHKGVKSNARGTTIPTVSSRSRDPKTAPLPPECYRLVFGQCQVEFVVLESEGVKVRSVTPIEFDPGSYVDGVPLMSETQR